jgi:hypothetical protein
MNGFFLTTSVADPQPDKVKREKKTHHEGPSVVEPQPKLGISRAKAQRPQNNGEKFSKIIHLFPPNLARFAPWQESIPRLRVFQITEKFARAAQTF